LILIKKTVQLALQVGDKVLLFDESVRRGRSKKLSAQWVGPYVVLAVEGVNATIKRGRSAIKVHLNRLKPFFLKKRERGWERDPTTEGWGRDDLPRARK